MTDMRGQYVLQGLAAAAATREAAKRKREATESSSDARAAKQLVRPIPVISHEVAVPKGYDEAAAGLDPTLHGEVLKPLIMQSPCQHQHNLQEKQTDSMMEQS
jgi:hypothetical protein